MSIQSSISAKLRYSIAIEIPMEIPVQCTTLALDRALVYFLNKYKSVTLKKFQNELLNAGLIICLAHNLNASLEAIYQDVYRLTIVISFDELSLVEDFIGRAEVEFLVSNILIKYAITADIPMQYSGILEKKSLLATETNMRQKTKFTADVGAKYDLNNAANLLNFALQHGGQKIESMYSVNDSQPKLLITISFSSQEKLKSFINAFQLN